MRLYTVGNPLRFIVNCNVLRFNDIGKPLHFPMDGNVLRLNDIGKPLRFIVDGNVLRFNAVEKPFYIRVWRVIFGTFGSYRNLAVTDRHFHVRHP